VKPFPGRDTRYLIIGAALLVSHAVAAQGNQPAAAAIQEAIDRGYKAKRCEVASGRAKPLGRATGFDIVVLGPLNRVECAAASAARKYLPFTSDSVPRELLEDVVTIEAYPLKPELMSDGWRITPPASHLVLRDAAGGDDSQPIQPDSVALVAAEWSNAAGGKFEGTGVIARYRAAALPTAGLQIFVITAEREYKTKISKDEAKRIR